MDMQWGLQEGLAQNGGWDQRINSLRYNEQQDQRAAAEAEAKAKLFADDIDFKNAMNPYDHARAFDFANNKVNEIGQFVKNNPNYKYDNMLQLKLKQLKNEVKDNEHTRRGMVQDASQTEFNKDLVEATKNPQEWDAEAMKKYQEQFNNYNHFGHPEGQSGFDREGAKPVIYKRPQMFVPLDKTGQELGNNFHDMQRRDVKNGRIGAFETVPNQQTLLAYAHQLYNQHKSQFDQQYTNKGLDPIKAASNFITGGIKTTYDHGERNTLQDQMALEAYKQNLKKANSSPGASPYHITVMAPGYAQPPADHLASTFGNDLPFKITNGTKTVEDNSPATFHHDGVIYDEGFRSDKKYQKTGKKVIEGYVLKPLSWVNDHPDLFKDPWGPNGLYGTIDPKDDWKNVISYVDSPVDKEGKSNKLVKIKVKSVVNANDPTYEGRYNKEILTTKQREGVGVNESSLEDSYEGHPVGSVIKTSKGSYLVTPEGYAPQ